MSSNSSDSEPEPPPPSYSEQMESQRLGIEALLAQVPKSLRQSDISELASNSGDEVKSDQTVPKTKPRSKIIHHIHFVFICQFNSLILSKTLLFQTTSLQKK